MKLSQCNSNKGIKALILLYRFWIFIFALFFFSGFTARAEDIGVYGPEQFTRSTGNPVKIQKTVAVTNPAASYRLYIVNGGLQDNTQIGEFVSASTIYWNGSLIAGPSNFNQQTPTLALPVTAQSTNTLTVELRGKPGGSITVQLLRGNQTPIAHAGADQTLYVGDISKLDGSTSTDSDGDALSYRWQITAAPASSLSQLSNSAAMRPELPIDRYGNYQVDLIVNDGFLDSVPDQVVIDTRNSAPVANAGADQSAFVGGIIDLDGGASHDVDGNTLSYRWNLAEKPAASNAVIIDDRLQQCRIAIDKPGHYVAQLIVNDGALDSEPDLVDIDTQNSKPVANAGLDQTNKIVGIPVELDGSLSSDVDGDALTYLWSMLHQPEGGNVLIRQADQAKATFTPDKPGDYVGQLIVNDGQANSDPATTLITVSAAAPVNNPPLITTSPLLNATVGAGYSYNVDAQDADGDTLSFSLTTYPTGMTINAQSGQITWIPGAHQTGVHSVNVSVSDGKGGSDSQSYTIAVVPTGLITVPNLVTLSRTAAETAIVNAKLTVGTMGFIHNPASAGSVISQSPNAGASAAEGATVSLTLSLGPDQGLPPDPAIIAPQSDATVATTISASTAFLYSGSNPIQTGVAAGSIDVKRAAVIRGKALDKDNKPLPGVTITVKDHPEFGQTLSRIDGQFDLAVNGGGYLILNYQKPGFLPIQRKIDTPWQQFAIAEDVVLIPLDVQVTTVDLAANTQQVAQGSAVTDGDGQRQATVLFPAGTQATMTLGDGSTQPLTSIHVRATEYTVGTNGPKAMPGPLPPASGYTYAVELSVDEAQAAGAAQVNFSQPLPVYVDNFLGFPVGSTVPAGWYDPAKGIWMPSDNGRIIKLLNVTAGVAELDVDGDGVADDAGKLSSLGITDAERARLASTYATGKSLWRVPVTHFTAWDFNWPWGFPNDAVPPDGGEPSNGDEDNPDTCDGDSVLGCVIETQSQILGEDVAITGSQFKLHYRSDRVPGRKSNYSLKIPLSAASVPASLKRIEMVIEVAGRRFSQSFPAQPNLTQTFTWDGIDVYGQPVQGRQTATVRIGYVYSIAYYQATPTSTAFGAASGSSGGSGTGGLVSLLNRSNAEITSWKSWQKALGAFENKAAGLGAWSLSVHHAYDPIGRVLYQGNGGKRSVTNADAIITTIAGNGTAGYGGDGGSAKSAKLSSPRDVSLGADGSLYIADAGNGRIRRIGTDGIISTVAGGGSGFIEGAGATSVSLASPAGIAVASDGRFFIADRPSGSVKRVDPDHSIRTVASGLDAINVALGNDGSLFITNNNAEAINRLAPNGVMERFAGGRRGFSGDGGPAQNAGLTNPGDIAVGTDGSLYIADAYAARVRRVDAAGIIRTIAGGGNQPADGVPALTAQLNATLDVAEDAKGGYYLTDIYGHSLRWVGADGILRTLAGTGVAGYSGDGGPARNAQFNNPAGVATAPDGSIYIADLYNHCVRKIQSLLPPFTGADILIPSEDGQLIYSFTASGRHLETRNALTQAVIYRFAYDMAGRLSEVKDGDGNITRIERDALGQATAIIAPYGQKTALTFDANGYLATVANPATETFQMTYGAEGLLTRFADPKAQANSFRYDNAGRLLQDVDAAGGGWTLNRTQNAAGFTSDLTTAEGRVNRFQVEPQANGDRKLVNTSPDGNQETRLFKTNGELRITAADGTLNTVQEAADPRFGLLAPIPMKRTVTTGGLSLTVNSARSVALSDPNNPFSLTSLTDTLTVNGRSSTSVYDVATKTYTSTSPAARQTKTVIDNLGRPTQIQATGLLPIINSYDPQGRPATIGQGTGVDERLISFAYNPQGYLDSVTDPIGRQVKYQYDLAGRVTKKILPDNREILFNYDANGNLIALSPPGRPDHGFTYTPVDQTASSVPPDVAAGSNSTLYHYNLDKQLTQIQRPDGQTVDYTYDTAGRTGKVTVPEGDYLYGYHASTGKLISIDTPDGLGLDYSFNGALPTQTSWSGAVSGNVGKSYDNDFRVASISVNGANAVSYGYDADSLLNKAGDLSLSRDAQNGLLTGTTLGNLTDSYSYNGFGEVSGYLAQYATSDLYKVSFSRDKLGRISQKIETVGGVTSTYDYGYDEAGRLSEVKLNGTVQASYGYDANGNRTQVNGQTVAHYDDQDRLLDYGSASYAYTANGELKTKTIGTATTAYSYDVLGNLRHVALSGGTAIDYLVDGQNRRIGKKRNNVLEQSFLYQDQLKPAAELDGNGNVVSRFIYATAANVPDYMIKGGNTYRIVKDHLGSPRLVVNIADNTMMQEMRYDVWGKVTQDTNPGFQPFGFAGGLYDRDTGLVRFGARDYDPQVGRWTAKDPIGFGGGDTGLYTYVGNNPLTHIDPLGLCDCTQILEDALNLNNDSGYGFNGNYGPGPGKNKCNLFIDNALKNTDVVPKRWSGLGGPISAGTWGDPNAYIPHFPVTDNPQPGDAVAIAYPYSNASGHVAIVVEPGKTSIGAGRDGSHITGWPWDTSLEPQGTPVYRHCDCRRIGQ